VNEIVPVLVAQLGHVHPERSKQVERMARRHAAFRKRGTQRDRLLLAVALAGEFRLEQIEIGELVCRGQRRMIGDVVGGPDEIVERKNQRPVPRVNEKGGNRKILVAVSLAGSQFACCGHRDWLNHR
jgi:hypothetical protein